MTRERRWRALGGVVGAVAMLAGTEAAAVTFRPGAWSAAAEVGFELDDRETTTGGATSAFRRRRFEEELRLRNNGFFLADPRLFTGTLEGIVGLFQEDARAEGDDDRSRQGTLLGYTFEGTFLAEKPYVTAVFANRAESVLTRDFGGRSEITTENRGITFLLREDSPLRDLGFPFFGLRLGARQERFEEDTVVLGQAFRRDETRNILTVDARKGFETSDLELHYEFADVDDNEGALGGFQTHRAALNYSLDFGRTLNRRWDSRLDFLERTGRTPSTFLSAEETLRLDHHEDLFTEYRYLFSLNDTETGDTTSHTGTALLQHRLYESLVTRLTAGASSTDFATGGRDRYFGDADLTYHRMLPRAARLFGAAGARYQVDEFDFSMPLVRVIDEPHVAPTPLGGGAGFTLADPFVIVSTIEVVDDRGGARLPTTEGIDYLIVQEGDFTRIVPLAGSPVILAGDPLLVSYTFEVATDFTSQTVSWRATAGVDFGWIALRVIHRQSDEDLVSGRNGQFLADRTEDAVRLDLRGDFRRGQAQATAEYRVEDGSRVEFSAWEFGQLVSFRPVDSLSLGVSAHQTLAEFTRPARRTESFSVRGTVDWSPLQGLLVGGFAGLRLFDDSELPPETVREAGVRSRWTIGKLDLVPTATWTEWERGSTETTDVRLEIRVIRRFF